MKTLIANNQEALAFTQSAGTKSYYCFSCCCFEDSTFMNVFNCGHVICVRCFNTLVVPQCWSCQTLQELCYTGKLNPVVQENTGIDSSFSFYSDSMIQDKMKKYQQVFVNVEAEAKAEAKRLNSLQSFFAGDDKRAQADLQATL